MKRTLKRRTEITIETHQTITWRRRAASVIGTTHSPETSADEAEIPLLMSGDVQDPGVQISFEGEEEK